MTCVVCGAKDTVKSHTIPRSLFHATKRSGKPIIANAQSHIGYQLFQSGHWDNRILCAEHEARLGIYDGYGAIFCKSFLTQLSAGQTAAVVENPQPERLVRFTGACVWRFAASRTNGNPDKLLGTYAGKLEEMLLRGGAFDPLLLISRHGYQDLSGALLNMGTLPFVYHEEKLRFWRFIVCGLIFDLKLDNRAPIPAMRTLAANALQSITIFEDFPQDPARDPAIGSSLIRMSAKSPRRPQKRGR
jgi:hypothetical protein